MTQWIYLVFSPRKTNKNKSAFELLFILSDMFPEYSFTDYFGLSCWTPFKIYPTLDWVGYINLFI